MHYSITYFTVTQDVDALIRIYGACNLDWKKGVIRNRIVDYVVLWDKLVFCSIGYA